MFSIGQGFEEGVFTPQNRFNPAQLHSGFDPMNGLTTIPPNEIASTDIPDSLSELYDFEKKLLNYSRNDEKTTVELVDFITKHPNYGLYEFQISILIRPRLDIDYAYLFSKLPIVVKSLFNVHLVSNRVFSEYLVKLHVYTPQQAFLLCKSKETRYCCLNLELIPDDMRKEVDFEVIDAMVNDSVDSFVEYTSRPDFNFDQTVCYDNHAVTYLNIAALYSAVNIFKFLIQNSVNLYKIEEFALAGGNQEIIHIVQTNNGNFEHKSLIPLCYRHDTIYDWLTENLPQDEHPQSYMFTRTFSIPALINFAKLNKTIFHHDFLTSLIRDDLVGAAVEAVSISPVLTDQFFMTFNPQILSAMLDRLPRKLLNDFLDQAIEGQYVDHIKTMFSHEKFNLIKLSDNMMTKLSKFAPDVIRSLKERSTLVKSVDEAISLFKSGVALNYQLIFPVIDKLISDKDFLICSKVICRCKDSIDIETRLKYLSSHHELFGAVFDSIIGEGPATTEHVHMLLKYADMRFPPKNVNGINSFAKVAIPMMKDLSVLENLKLESLVNNFSVLYTDYLKNMYELYKIPEFSPNSKILSIVKKNVTPFEIKTQTKENNPLLNRFQQMRLRNVIVRRFNAVTPNAIMHQYDYEKESRRDFRYALNFKSEKKVPSNRTLWNSPAYGFKLFAEAIDLAIIHSPIINEFKSDENHLFDIIGANPMYLYAIDEFNENIIRRIIDLYKSSDKVYIHSVNRFVSQSSIHNFVDIHELTKDINNRCFLGALFYPKLEDYESIKNIPWMKMNILDNPRNGVHYTLDALLPSRAGMHLLMEKVAAIPFCNFSVADIPTIERDVNVDRFGFLYNVSGESIDCFIQNDTFIKNCSDQFIFMAFSKLRSYNAMPLIKECLRRFDSTYKFVAALSKIELYDIKEFQDSIPIDVLTYLSAFIFQEPLSPDGSLLVETPQLLNISNATPSIDIMLSRTEIKNQTAPTPPAFDFIFSHYKPTPYVSMFLFMKAIEYNNLEVMKFIMSNYDIDINAIMQVTPLQNAMICKNIPAFEYLIEHGASFKFLGIGTPIMVIWQIQTIENNMSSKTGFSHRFIALLLNKYRHLIDIEAEKTVNFLNPELIGLPVTKVNFKAFDRSRADFQKTPEIQFDLNMQVSNEITFGSIIEAIMTVSNYNGPLTQYFNKQNKPFDQQRWTEIQGSIGSASDDVKLAYSIIKGIDVIEKVNVPIDSILYLPVVAGDFNIVQKLFSFPEAKLSIEGLPVRVSPVLQCIVDDRVDILDFFVNNGFDINTIYSLECVTPINVSILYNAPNCFDYLVSRCSLEHIVVMSPMMCAMYALSLGNPKYVNDLLPLINVEHELLVNPHLRDYMKNPNPVGFKYDGPASFPILSKGVRNPNVNLDQIHEKILRYLNNRIASQHEVSEILEYKFYMNRNHHVFNL